MSGRVRIGTAGWSLPRKYAHQFPDEGSGLSRYTARFDAAEVNSTFYRSHKPETLERWAASVPDDFRFAVKLPRAITHERKLADSADLLDRFLAEARLLGPKLGPLLVQLPPSLQFDVEAATAFFRELRTRFDGPVACEPRHPTWFEPPADELLRDGRVARVAADPARVPEAARPGGWPGLAYYRLHGSPRMYYSEYQPEFIERLAREIDSFATSAEVWCIFDNTVSGAATGNALELMAGLQGPERSWA